MSAFFSLFPLKIPNVLNFFLFAGGQIIRTCDNLQINDCKSANGVKYCYCSSDLCNGKYTPPPTSQPIDIIDEHDRKSFMSDDEDLMEASGSKETTLFDPLDPNILHTETETSERIDHTVHEQTIPWTPSTTVTTAKSIYLTTTEEPHKVTRNSGTTIIGLCNLLLLGIIFSLSSPRF